MCNFDTFLMHTLKRQQVACMFNKSFSGRDSSYVNFTFDISVCKRATEEKSEFILEEQ